jgi:hypothetical protein
MENFHGRRPEGRPRLRWEDNIRRRRLAGDRGIWRRTFEEARALCAIEE